MIDIHCHILPKLDDGAAVMEEALGIARAAVASGVTGIVATPHFPGRPESLEMLGAILDRYRSLRICLEKAGIPLRIFPGAEILCLPNTAKMARQRQLPTLGNSDYLLCEFYFQESRAYMTRQLRELADSGYRIVVAHPERYEAVRRDPRIAEKWFDAGYVLQLNKDSLLGNFGSRVEKTARTLLDNGRNASDLQKLYGIPDFVARKAMEAARRFKPEFLRRAANLVLETDYKMKTSFDDNERLLELLILQLAQEARNG